MPLHCSAVNPEMKVVEGEVLFVELPAGDGQSRLHSPKVISGRNIIHKITMHKSNLSLDRKQHSSTKKKDK